MSDLLWYELPFYYTGLTTPTARFIGAFTVTNAIILSVKPSFAFTHKGDFKYLPWPDDGHLQKYQKTWVPWWVPGIVAGVVCSIFI